MTRQTSLTSLHWRLRDRNHISKALDALHAIQRILDILVDNTAEVQKGELPPRVLSPTSILHACGTTIPHFLLIPPFLSHWVKATLTCYTSLVTFTFISTKSGWDMWYRYHQQYKRTFSIFRTIPIPVHMDQENFLYIDVGYSTLCQENYVELAWFPSHGFSLTVEVFYSWWILLVCGTLPPPSSLSTRLWYVLHVSHKFISCSVLAFL
jgi:hypothetical protein